MIGTVLITLAIVSFLLYLLWYHKGRLLLVYPLIAYVLLWPKFMHQIGFFLIKGEFGSIRIGDLFLFFFLFVFFLKLADVEVHSAISTHWPAMIMVSLFVGYWCFQLFLMFQEGTARKSLNQLRPLAYYAFLIFLLFRLKSEDDVKGIIKAFSFLAVLVFIEEMLFIALHENNAIKSYLRVMTPNIYKDVYLHRRFGITYLKNLFIMFPFFLNLLFIHNPMEGRIRWFRYLVFPLIVFIFVVGQSRAIWLVLSVGSFISIFMLILKGQFTFSKFTKAIITFTLAMSTTAILIFTVGEKLAPGLLERIEAKAHSIPEIEEYKKEKELESLESRILSYKLVLERIENDWFFGKGLGAQITKTGPFRRFVDSTYLTTVWCGGFVALTLLLLFLYYLMWQSCAGYLKSSTNFEIYFFTSSTVCILNTVVLAIQDNILCLGNSVITFTILAAMVLSMKAWMGQPHSKMG